MKNENQEKYFCLNNGDKPPKLCPDGEKHDWIVLEKPEQWHSGYHEDKCQRCGIIVMWDDSD